MRALALTLVLLAAASAQVPSRRTPTKSAQSTGPNLQFWKMSRQSVDYLLQPVPQSNELRLAQLKQTFHDVECRDSDLRQQPTPAGTNLLCTLSGTAPAFILPTKRGAPALPNNEFGTILFIAHYEHEGPGQSAVDNWTGAITLPFLYHALTFTPRHHTFVFAEVDGEAGARALFNSFTLSERHAIKGVVALDALGLGPTEFYLSSNDISEFSGLGWAFLGHQFLQAAVDDHLDPPRSAIPGSWQKIDDTLEFRHRSIPSILIHSVTWPTRDLPGSSHDTASAINHDIYFDTLVLLAYYAVELDQPWPSPAGDAASRPSSGRRR